MIKAQTKGGEETITGQPAPKEEKVEKKEESKTKKINVKVD